jgi:5-methylcytosine-specific restriction protein A
MKLRDRTPRLRGRALQKRRGMWFAQHPLCVLCERQGRVERAMELDHVVPLFKGGLDEPQNWQGLCVKCHEAKTREDMGAREVVRYGADGWPLIK